MKINPDREIPQPVSAMKQHQSVGLTSVIKPLSEEGKNAFLEIIQNKKVKQAVNNWSNWGAAGLNVLTFTNANFNFLDQVQDTLEKSSELFTKLTYIITGITATVDLWGKKNLIPFLGFASGIPLTIMSSNYNLFLAYGIPYGLGNFAIITDQREVVDEDGEPVVDKDGNVQLINGDFSKRGWMAALSTTGRESVKIVKELIQKPQRVKKISHALFTSSIFEMFGPVISYLGLENIGSLIRSSGTIATQTAFLLHNDSNKKASIENHGKITLKSSIALGGLFGIGGSAIDFLKRSEFISEKIANLTNLSLGLDRAMGALIVSGIMDMEKDQGGSNATKENRNI